MPIRPQAVAVLGALALIVGCAEKRGGPPPSSDPMRAEPPLWQRTSEGRPGVQPVDTSGPIAMTEAQPPPPRGLSGEAQPERISPTVREAVRPLDEEAMRRMAGGAPATAPVAPTPPANRRSPGDAPETTGGYQLVGTVLAEVHDQPIFADKVLAGINSALAAQAAQLDEQPFRRAAADLIAREVQRRINDELEFAMARDRLDARDRELARMAAIRWRDEQITKAGGSLEVARQRASAAGYDFDELQEEQFRWLLRQLYYQKREYPKIQVSASDIRRYYQENEKREFTAPDRARFRVIKVDKGRPGGADAARGEINRLLDRVRSGGKDFAEVAAQDNDQESFKQPVDWFQRGSFVVKEVEDAVWKLEPGQITDVIETPAAFYIAKLEARQPGGTKSFNEPDVQAQIVATLRQQQFSALQRKVQEQLRSDAIIRYHPRMMDIAVEMAMQKYRYWREQASAR
jgi:parvulin-like peptidyl-prolyl isomerase